MWPAIAAVLGVVGTVVSYFVGRQNVDPYQERIEQLERENKLAVGNLKAAVKRVGALEQLLMKLERANYAKMSDEDLLAIANALPGDGMPSN